MSSLFDLEIPDLETLQQQAPTGRAVRLCRWTGRVCGSVVAALGGLALLSHLLQHFSGQSNALLHLLAGQLREDDLELAVTTGLGFLLCGGVLLLNAHAEVSAARQRLARIAAVVVTVGGAYELLAFAVAPFFANGIGLYADAQMPPPFSQPPMSPLTAAFFLLAGLALLFVCGRSKRGRAWAAALSILVLVFNGVVLLGYAHDVKLLSTLLGTPVALATSTVFAILSAGLICRLGAEHFPLRPFLGSGSRALLLRAFVPVVLAVLVVNSIARSHVDSYLSALHSRSWRQAYKEHLSSEQLAEMVQKMIESDASVLSATQSWAYQRARWHHQLPSDEATATIENYWNGLSAAEKWEEYSSYRRNNRKQHLSLFAAAMTLLSAGILFVLIAYASRIIGNILDAAERTRVRALIEMRKARDDAETANDNLRQINEQLSTARDAAEAASRTKSQFLANMNHELRTPLNSIILYAEELMDEHQGETALLGDLQVILDRGKHLVGLINDILEHAKLEANMVKLEPTDICLLELVRDVAATIEPLAEKNGNRVRLDCPQTLGVLHADPMRVKQCLLNMLSNANKFTQNGTIDLIVRRETVEEQDWIVLRVKDNGIGMTPEQQERIFQRFMQADSSTTRRYGGTGLGLSISRGLSRLMGGELFLEESRPGAGSTFTLRLPAPIKALSEEEETSALTVSGPLAIEVPDADGHNTILVIDDDRDVRDLLIRQLGKEGFHAVGVSRGEEALQLARQLHPQVITLDVMMPGMDGWSVLSALKSDVNTADIPVIIVSIIDDKNLGYALGAAEYLVKPTNRERLIEVLKRFCHFPSSGLALIAEDDADMRGMLRRLLEQENWNVAEARNGREALDSLAQQSPSLILLDLLMPEMDGFEFLTELRRNPHWQSIPVVVITAKELTQEDRMFLNGSLLLSGCVKRVLEIGSYSRDELLGQVHELVSKCSCR